MNYSVLFFITLWLEWRRMEKDGPKRAELLIPATSLWGPCIAAIACSLTNKTGWETLLTDGKT